MRISKGSHKLKVDCIPWPNDEQHEDYNTRAARIPFNPPVSVVAREDLLTSRPKVVGRVCSKGVTASIMREVSMGILGTISSSLEIIPRRASVALPIPDSMVESRFLVS
jgi:hypothetical protein